MFRALLNKERVLSRVVCVKFLVFGTNSVRYYYYYY